MKVLMIGAGRDVKGGVSTVVNQYYEAGLDKLVDLTYVPTMIDGNKLKKFIVAIRAYVIFSIMLKEADVVHVHMSHRASFFRKSYFIKKAHKKNKKIIIHMHGSEFDVFYEKECSDKQKEFVREIFCMADAVIALSNEWKEKLSSICDSNKICVLNNAVKIPSFRRSSYNDKNVLFFGRLGKRKGTYDLLRAIPVVLSKIPQAHFYLGGDGDVQEVLNIIKENGLQETVEYVGWVQGEEKIKLLEQCSVFVLPSYHEGMPMAILEAMSFGEVVVSTNVGGIPQVIESGVNGYLHEPGNINQLVSSLLIALESDNKNFIGNNAFKTIYNSFNIENNLSELIKLYNRI